MKKIALNKETLRKLDDQDLTYANGGIHPTCVPTQTVPETVLTCRCTRLECYTLRACPGGPTNTCTELLC